MKILLDAMGGDNAPKSTVQGAADAVKEFGDGMTLALLGDEAKIKAAGGRQIKGAEVKSMIAGNTVYFIALTQVGPLRPGTVGPVWHPDERRRFLGTGNGNKVEALWWVDGDSYCNERKISGPGHSCNMVWESNGSLYFCPAQGDCIYSARIVPGNPEKL